jgi:hypothetical protein
MLIQSFQRFSTYNSKNSYIKVLNARGFLSYICEKPFFDPEFPEVFIQTYTACPLNVFC